MVNIAGEGRTFSSSVQSWEVTSAPVNYPHPEHAGNADPTQGSQTESQPESRKIGGRLVGKKGGLNRSRRGERR